ncbi:hypothetical protein DNL40_11885 [Xylanimonas oleitrophica]|uniref:TauD/TfdA-like domain-containing protein n=1 Tax=Xylanimonas oleitrophica TaxID=2607479 RepID=A0A2W5YDJ5_9MICO|nr:TauD/TfdA family dioxygenase [Xylanimonas oleitrophica]PZR52371.1 hypothetical protein DNL40_11885 [Xylanimonas oleitrophica]
MTVLRVNVAADDVADSLALAAAAVGDSLVDHGAVVLRGIPPTVPLVRVRAALGLEPHTPGERFGIRPGRNGVLGPLAWPASEQLCPTQEETFGVAAPHVLITRCTAVPAVGGRTLVAPVAALRGVLAPELYERVVTDGWRLRRVFRERFGITWREAFGVDDEVALERRLAAAGIDWTWTADGTLTTVRRLPGAVTHPLTQELTWFNQLTFLNALSVDERRRAVLAAAFGDELPTDTTHGSGEPVSPHEIVALQDAHDAIAEPVATAVGDIVVADNYLVALGREAYEGLAGSETVLATREPESPVEPRN